MKDATKNLVSFAWGTSLLGAKQIAGLLTLSQPQGATARVAGRVGNSVSQELGDGVFQSLYKLGNILQRDAVDLAFKVVPLDAASRLISDVIQSVAPWPGWGPDNLCSPGDAVPPQEKR